MNSNYEKDKIFKESDVSQEDLIISEELNFAKDFEYEENSSASTNKSSKVDVTASEKKSKKKDNPHKGHRSRMLKRYEENGFSGFQEHEVLEMLLYHCIPYKDTNALAHNLINEFGTIDNVLSAGVLNLVNAGLSVRSALILSQYKELENYLRSHKPTKNFALYTTEIAGEFCCERFGYDLVESLHLISMKADRKIIAVNTISRGSSTKTDSNIPLIIKTALKTNADCILLCHNHPSGNLNPSSEDIEVTRRVIELIESVDVYMADHIICYKDKYVSLFERGII